MTEGLIQYTNVIIPLMVSVVGGIATYWATLKVNDQRITQLENDVIDEKKSAREVRDMVVACNAILKEREPYTKRESRVSLTDRGQGLLKDSGGEEFIDRYFDELFKTLEKRKPKTAYDVQEYAVSVLEDKTDDNSFNELKEYIYWEGLEIEKLVGVMGIYFRDKALAKLSMNTF
jgi:hypothetical protein